MEFRQSLGMNLSVPFSLKGSSKCTNHVNVHKLYAVEYINKVCSLAFQYAVFKFIVTPVCGMPSLLAPDPIRV